MAPHPEYTVVFWNARSLFKKTQFLRNFDSTPRPWTRHHSRLLDTAITRLRIGHTCLAAHLHRLPLMNSLGATEECNQRVARSSCQGFATLVFVREETQQREADVLCQHQAGDARAPLSDKIAEKITIENLDDVQKFLNKEDCLAILKHLGKQELVLVSAYLGVKIRESVSRVEILSKVPKHLKAREKQESEAQSTKESEVASTEKEDKGSDGESDAGELNISFLIVKMRTLEINREIEWKKLEIEWEIKEKEMAMKEKEIEKEMEMKRLELQERENKREDRRESEERERQEKEKEMEMKRCCHFGLAKGKFGHHDVTQSVLTGKAQIAYSTLSLDDSSDYDAVKKVVLMAYQLVPEAYRQKFRNLKKTSEHTFTEFANIKERLFQEWCASRKVKTKEQLEQRILLEDFKDCLSGDLKTYLEEQQVETLSAAATMAEEYILTQRSSTSWDRSSTRQRLGDRFELRTSQDGGRSSNKKHRLTVTEATEREEGPHEQAPTDTQESGVTADKYLRHGKVQCSLNRPEIPQTSKISVSLKDYQTGARNAFCDQPSAVPRHREVSICPRSSLCRSLPKTREIIVPLTGIPKPKPNSFLVGRCYEPDSIVGARNSDVNAICYEGGRQRQCEVDPLPVV
ncbi:trichoplein keratin filament-binding protein-like [Procambarus clarkii]|uniref:trichoplein keratin filament-binding protein-like n=1 Tax=Procambarus clarkii TaxID=6728 RepID=UPI003743B60F